jgi:hypothetical protein
VGGPRLTLGGARGRKRARRCLARRRCTQQQPGDAQAACPAAPPVRQAGAHLALHVLGVLVGLDLVLLLGRAALGGGSGGLLHSCAGGRAVAGCCAALAARRRDRLDPLTAREGEHALNELEGVAVAFVGVGQGTHHLRAAAGARRQHPAPRIWVSRTPKSACGHAAVCQRPAASHNTAHAVAEARQDRASGSERDRTGTGAWGRAGRGRIDGACVALRCEQGGRQSGRLPGPAAHAGTQPKHVIACQTHLRAPARLWRDPIASRRPRVCMGVRGGLTLDGTWLRSCCPAPESAQMRWWLPRGQDVDLGVLSHADGHAAQCVVMRARPCAAPHGRRSLTSR